MIPPSTFVPRPARRVRAGALLAGGFLGLLAVAPASAHVSVSPSSAPAGAGQLLEFSFAHGCEGSPTTAVTVKLPEELLAATPQRAAGWDVEIVREKLETAVVDAHGAEVLERVSAITWTAADPVPDGVRDTLALQVTPAEELAGRTLAFPVVQECAKGANDWTQVAADGVDPHSLDSPAPVLKVTQSNAEAGHHDHAASDASAATASHADDDAFEVMPVVALAAGVLGLVLGGAALARGRN